MKKVAAILLAVMMMVSLIACAKTDVPAADTKTESQPAAQNDAAPKKEETPAAPAFPTKPITMNLTGKPGSGTDILFRALGSALEAETGCTMVCVSSLFIYTHLQSAVFV